MHIWQAVRIFLSLIKVTVTLPVTFLCFAGFVYFNVWLNGLELLLAFYCSLGVFLLSGAACTINQVMEKNYDRIMERTRNRPLPSGQISSRNALIIAMILFLGGMAILYDISAIAALLGLLSNIWYLGIYTLLKRKTAFATIPGAITGILPFLIGWVCAGGNLLAPNVILISFYLYLWQIPHFWSLMMVYGDDYEKAGFPTLQRIFSPASLRLWTFIWVVAAICISLLLVYFKVVAGTPATLMLALLSLSMMISSALLLFKGQQRQIKILFHLINVYMLANVMFVVWDRLIQLSSIWR